MLVSDKGKTQDSFNHHIHSSTLLKPGYPPPPSCSFSLRSISISALQHPEPKQLSRPFQTTPTKTPPPNQTTKPLHPSILSCLPLPSSPSSQLNPTQPPYLPEGNAPFLRIRKYLSLQALMLTSSGKSPLSHSSAQVLNPFVTRTPASPNAVFSSSVHMWIFLPAMLPPTFPPLLRRWRVVLAAA